MMMMNCFCSMVDWRKAFSLISSWDHCQRSSPSWISDMPWAGFEPAQNQSSDLVEWSCASVITTTPRHHKMMYITILDCFIEVIYVNKEQGRTQNRSVRNSIIDIYIYIYIYIFIFWRETIYAVAVPSDMSWTAGVQLLLSYSDSIY